MTPDFITLEALWDAAAAFHAYWFPDSPQPWRTQNKLLFEELAEFVNDYLADDDTMIDEACDVLFVVFGYQSIIGTSKYEGAAIALPDVFKLDAKKHPTVIMGYLLDSVPSLVMYHGNVSGVYLAEIIVSLWYLCHTDQSTWDAAIARCVAKNAAKTREAGYAVAADGKVRRVQS